MIFLSGICDEGMSQKPEGDGHLIDYWTQYRGEGIPVDAEEDGISFTDPRGAEMGQLILNDATDVNVWAGVPDATHGWDSIADGQATYYRVPWMCWRGFNAGAFEAARQIDEIITREFESLELAVKTSNRKYNPRQVFIVAHSAGGLVTRTMLANWGDLSPNGDTILLPPGDPRRRQLKLLFNNPAAMANGGADANAIGAAAPNVPVTNTEIEQFMERSTRIRRHVAGAVLLTSPLYGSPVTRLSATRVIKALGGGLPSAMMMDEAFIAELHQPGGVLYDRVTYPSPLPFDLVPADPEGKSGIPVLLVAGASSQPKTTANDVNVGGMGQAMMLFPVIDRWIAEHRWREPLTSVCEGMAPLICEAAVVSSGILPATPELARAVCAVIMDVEVGNSSPSMTLGDYTEEVCALNMWLATEPLALSAAGTLGNPFDLFKEAINCDSLCANVEGRPLLQRFCDVGCSCVVEKDCDVDRPSSWWCCPDEVAGDLVGWLRSHDFDVTELVEKACDRACELCDNTPCRQLGSRRVCEFVSPFCGGCLACDLSGHDGIVSISDILDFAGIHTPATDEVAKWSAIADPASWVITDMDDFNDLLSTVCPLLSAGILVPPLEMGSYEARFGKNALEATCEVLENLDPQYLQNGWAGDMFDHTLVSQAGTTCNTDELDQVKVAYDAVMTLAVGTAVDGAFKFANIDIGYPFQWGDAYLTQHDALFDNDVVVPTWSELMCSSRSANFPTPQNLSRYVAYASHETGKHSDEVARVVAGWM